jgi:broad specificity phosphatase PhoE
MALNITYAYFPGFFATDDPQADADAIGGLDRHLQLPDRFGLLDSSGSWEAFRLKIAGLNAENTPKDSVKVFFLGRHGEGLHNVASAKHGKQAWRDYWARLDGDGTIVWGLDSLLTPLGVQQAQAVHEMWSSEIPFGIPVPTVFYSSPHIRATRTLEIAWTGITLPNAAKDYPLYPSHKVVISENCREAYGVRVCDKRHPKSWIAERHPSFTFNEGFTEGDELWTPDHRETDEHIDTRALAILEDAWAGYPEETYVSITAHSGIIRGFLRVVGRGTYHLHAGGVVAIVVRRTAS